MKKFTKLALVSSIALTTNAMAMQAMDDTALSATTGQDGLSIGIGISKIEIEKLLIHDNDGLAAKGAAGDAGFGGTGNAGAIVIKGNGVDGNANKTHGIVIGANYDDNGAYLLTSRNLADLVIDTDAGSTAAGGAFINVAAQVSGLDIKIGEIGVSASNTIDPNATNIRRGHSDSNYNAILSGLEIKTGKMDANIQLGAAPQGAMVKLNTTMVGGLEIKNLGILDNSTKEKAVGAVGTTAITTKEAGEIFIESIKIADADSKDLTLNQDIQVFNDAYVGGGTTLGKAAHIRIVSNDTGAKDQYIKGIHLGSRTAASIGDMEVHGLQTYYSTSQGSYTKGAVITISGH
ncbi:MAG TPA: pilus assembly protein FilA [Acinetobacter towneri]|nr:pilus assembly protein FilA [Acinetobacter towneri]